MNHTTDFTYLNGTKVLFNMDGRELVGTICGLSHTPQPVIGQGYIVQLEDTLYNYDYTHIVVFDAMIKTSLEMK